MFLAESTTIHLKVAKVQPEPGRVEDYHVPVVIHSDTLTNSNISLWDLTTQQVHFFAFIQSFERLTLMFNVDIQTHQWIKSRL